MNIGDEKWNEKTFSLFRFGGLFTYDVCKVQEQQEGSFRVSKLKKLENYGRKTSKNDCQKNLEKTDKNFFKNNDHKNFKK